MAERLQRAPKPSEDGYRLVAIVGGVVMAMEGEMVMLSITTGMHAQSVPMGTPIFRDDRVIGLVSRSSLMRRYHRAMTSGASIRCTATGVRGWIHGSLSPPRGLDSHLTNLPQQPGPLVGRDRARICHLVDDILETGGKPQACGWIIDKYGLRWQIVPRVLNEIYGTKGRRYAAIQIQLVRTFNRYFCKSRNHGSR